MNLIQRGTTASRANRGKSVKKSIAQYDGSGVTCVMQGPPVSSFRILLTVYLKCDASTHLTGLGQRLRRKVANQIVLS
jgi:hypothetical protein